MNWLPSSVKNHTRAYRCLLLTVLVILWQGARVTSDRCFSTTQCRGRVIPSVTTGRDCCVVHPTGMSYDSSGGTEACYRCEVIGWKSENVYVVQRSIATLVMGGVRGNAASRYKFKVEEIWNNASAGVMNPQDLTEIIYGTSDVGVKIQLPRYNENERYDEKNASYRLVRTYPVTLVEGKFFHPQEIILHVIVPGIEIERSEYTMGYWDTVPVCLVYNNTAGYAAFKANISLTRQNGKFSQEFEYNFNTESGRACTSLRLSPSAISDPFDVTEFTVTIESDVAFDIGSSSTATLTVAAVKAPTVEFEVEKSILELPLTSQEICLTRLPSDDVTENTTPFSVIVSLTRDLENSFELIFDFSENSTESCHNISLTPNETETDSSFLLLLDIVPAKNLSYRVGTERRQSVIEVEPFVEPPSGSGGIEEDGGDGDDGGEGGEDGEDKGGVEDDDDGGVEDVDYGGVKDEVGEDGKPELELEGEEGDSQRGLGTRGSDSGADSWVIAVSVSVPLLLIIIAIVVLVVIVGLYYYSAQSSYKPSVLEGLKTP